MGTVIKSVAYFKPLFRSGLVGMTARPSGRCLKSAGLNHANIHMLINTSVYSENHLSEPAIAALIQARLENNSGFPDKPERMSNLLSFDLHNGSAGTINAMQILDGFIRSGEVENGLIVSGDVRPRSGKTWNYPYSDSAGALLLADDPSLQGFVGFGSETFPAFENNFKSIVHHAAGCPCLEIFQTDDYLYNCVLCAESSVRRFLKEVNLNQDEIDLVLTSHSPFRFATEFQKRMKWHDKLILFNGKNEIFTAGIIYSLHKAFGNGQFRGARKVLFVTAGAGITISIALYLNY